MAKRWTEEEDHFIEEHIGAHTVQWISAKLGRTLFAVRKRMCDLQVQNLHEEAGTLSASALADAIGVSYETTRRWILEKDLPAVKKARYTGVNRRYMHYHVVPEDFWTWAFKHKHLIQFNKIEPQALPPEPAWVEEERKKQFRKPVKQKIWTPEEDATLLDYCYKQGLKQREIAIKLNRTQSSIEKRLKRLREMSKVC